MSLQSTKNLGVSDEARKAIAELQGLRINVASGAAAGNAIAITGIETEDTLASVLGFSAAVSPDAITDLTANASIVDLRATGTVTCLATIANGDYVTVNGKRYTFTDMDVNIATNLAPGVVPVSIDASGVCDRDAAAAALSVAIMSNDSKLTCTVANNVVTVFSRANGAGGAGPPKTGNSMTLATSSAHATVSGATFSGGSSTNAIKLDVDTTGMNLVVIWYNKQ